MYKIIVLSYFRRQLKRYIKKYPSVKVAVIRILNNFDKAKFARIGGNVYKIRLKVDEIQKGKSKSFRLLVLVVEIEKFIAPITLYFKGDRETLTKKEINTSLEAMFFELRAENLLK